jgi:hypothetical protein
MKAKLLKGHFTGTAKGSIPLFNKSFRH